jgi:hypothetical protein
VLVGIAVFGLLCLLWRRRSQDPASSSVGV